MRRSYLLPLGTFLFCLAYPRVTKVLIIGIALAILWAVYRSAVLG
jgi:hypothetical protein